ncbi:MAG TPA: MFS transporter, partial [Mycobacterium sp.]|nr:MFS transporter [Mycobacterium sp.]
NVAAVVIAFAATAMILPLMFYAQAVCGLSPTRSALLTAPMAITSGVLAPFVGRMVDRAHPQPVVGFGFSALAIGLTWLSIVMTPSTAIWELILPFFVLGVAMAFIWAPLTATATRNLAPQLAGAGSGVFNATRQVGAVLGSAGMASFMTSRITSELPLRPDGASGPPGGGGMALQMPAFLREPFAAAMSQSMLLPAFIALFGIGAALFLLGGSATAGASTADEARSGSPDAPARRVRVRPSAADGFADDFNGFRDGFDDDDDYVEYTLSPAPTAPPSRAASRPARRQVHEPRTEPLTVRIEHPRPEPAENRHSSPVESWRSLLDETDSAPGDGPIGFAHNGFHVDGEQRFRPVEDFSPLDQRRVDYDEPFFDDIDTYGGATDHAPRARGAAARDELRNGYHRPPPSRHRRSDPDDGYPGS